MPEWDPLADPIPKEVPLSDAPLIRVVAQARFPTILSIERTDAVAPFQEAVRGSYPFLRQEKGQGIFMGPAGLQSLEQQMIWRFSEHSDSSKGWSIALTKDFLALETQKYTSRDDFMSRFNEALLALNATFRPPALSRLGVRYVDRIRGAPVANIDTLIRKEVLSVAGLKVGVHLQHVVTDALFSIDTGALHARWGRMPRMSTFDPAAIEPIEDDSWVLDLDAFTQEQSQFDVDRIVRQAREFAERIYAFFRWAVTDEFLRHFGGNP